MTSTRAALRRTLWLAAAFGPPAAIAAGNPAEAVELGEVEVIGHTPLPGLGLPLSRVPANVQVFGRIDRSATLPDFLDRSAASVVASSGQGNPYQPDLAYRGFAASPVLGLPQGIGVFMDGVRVNEPFGDVVNWDLIPSSAIASVQLIPGTTPVFGPNTLGGALAIYTKSGARFPGGSVEALTGSWARRALSVEHGGSDGAWDYFVTANLSRDAGWAEHNQSDVRQLFAKVGRQTGETDLDLGVTLADNRLEGNQALPLSFLDDIRQPYTWPDRNANRAALVSLKGSRFIGEGWLLGGLAYVRRYRNENLSSNALGDADGAPGQQATNDRALVDQRSYGAGLQVTRSTRFAGGENQLVAGAGADTGDARFTRYSQPARFDASRGTEAIGPYALDTDADAFDAHYGVFVSDTLSVGAHWALTISARHDATHVEVRDRSGSEPRLDGDHRFSRLNPALGVTFSPRTSLTTYARYSEGMRAPTPLELTCADANAPCRLPNAFLSDPPLAAVVARTVEAGARGTWGERGTWSVAAFRTDLANDIQFVASGAAAPNAGYFRNVGATRRQGLEIASSMGWGRWDVAVRYALVDATFRTDFVEHSPNNSSADALGDILVAAGDRMPGIPRQTLKVRIDHAIGDAASWGIGWRAASRSWARGDENNRDANGPLPGYAVLDAHARWSASRRLELFAFVDNVLDKRYAGAGLLGRNVFTGPGRTYAPDAAVAEQFRSMGAPIGAWIGARYRWG